MVRSIEVASPQNLQGVGYSKGPSWTLSFIIYLLMTCPSAITHGEKYLIVDDITVYCTGTMSF